MNEIASKLQSCRKLMEKHQILGLRLRGVDWFSWATGGGNSVVIFTNEVGVAEVFITPEHAWILTDQIEKDRLATEEIPSEFEMMAFPWEDRNAATHFIDNQLNGRTCASDRPTGNEKSLPYEFQELKMRLGTDEVQRYHDLGRAAAEAMTEAITKAQPNWTEYQLAAAGAQSLWSRGIDPTLVMVGGEKRVQIYRHPIATGEKLGSYAMMVFCARQYGLYANLTRFIFFREPTAEERKKFELVAQVEAQAFANTKAETKLSSIYESLSQAYAKVGFPEDIHCHHQGGTTGYLSREQVASSFSTDNQILQPGMALAWNPSLPGAKIEDTVLLTENGLEILTVDPQWPTFQIDGRARPDIWIQK